MHAGAVLDPGVISNIALSSIFNEFGGKVEGAAKLMSQSRIAPLTVMNLFSSLAAFSGSGGQGGYAAANGVLDSWAQISQVQYTHACQDNIVDCLLEPLLLIIVADITKMWPQAF